jgi:hypothetical protein
VAVAAFVTYLPVVVVPYGFTDDYWNLGALHGLGGIPPWKFSTQGGRPLHALLLSGAFWLVPDIDSLRLLRLVGICGAALLGILLYHALRKSKVDPWLATGISISVISLPSFQVYVSWATLFADPYAAILGGVASLRLTSAFDQGSGVARVRRAQAAALLICALLIYQPGAMFFWVFAAIELLRPGEQLGRATRKLAASLVVGIGAMAFGFVVVKVGVHFFGGQGAGRSSLNHDVVGKVRWFFDQPLVNALNVFELVPKTTLAEGVALFAAVGILLLHADKGWAALGFLGIAVGLVPLSYLPNLAIAENWASYRSLGALSALLTLYVWLGLWGFARTGLALARRTGSRLAPAGARTNVGAIATGRLVVVAIAVTGLVLAARNATTLFAKPENIELQMLRSTLDNSNEPGLRRVIFVKPDWNQGAAPLVRYDEFGLPSSYAPWVPDPAVQLVLRERGRNAPRPAIDVLASTASAVPSPGRPNTVVVDMRKLQQRRIGWSFWTLNAASALTSSVRNVARP